MHNTIHFVLLNLYSYVVMTTGTPYWHIEYQDLSSGRRVTEEVPISQSKVQFDAVDFNNEYFEPRTKTIHLMPFRIAL